MAGRITELIWERFPGGGSELIAMLVFADEGNSQGKHIRPSLKTICHRMRLKETQARDVVHRLVEQGWIRIVGNEYGGARPREYEIAVERFYGTDKGSSPAEHRTPVVKHTPVNYDRGARGTRLAKDWEIPDGWIEWAMSERPDLDHGKLAEMFKDYWIAKPGKDGRKVDWLATWRNWIRAQKVEKHETHSKPDNSAIGKVRANNAKAEQREREARRIFDA